jgi:D-alanyl-D-alanine dipeptidase
MKWLVDVNDTVADCDYPRPTMQAGPRQLRPDDPLVPLDQSFARLPVYSWLPLSSGPAPLYLRAPVVDALREARLNLPSEFDFVVLDTWRSRAFQLELRDFYAGAVAPGDLSRFVSDPGAKEDPPHTTGGAVDLTLGWRGAALGLGTDFDDFTDAAGPDYLDRTEGAGASRAGRLRSLLSAVLHQAGFVVYPSEWWHWSLGDTTWAKARGLPGPVYREVGPPDRVMTLA